MILRSLVFWILCTAPQRKVLVFAEQNWQSIPFLRRGTPSTSSSSRCWRLENTMIKIFWGQVEQQNYDDSMTILVTSMRAMVAIWDKLKRSNPLIHPEIQMMLSYSKLHGSWPLGPPLSCLGPKSPPKSILGRVSKSLQSWSQPCRDLNWVRRDFDWVCRDFDWVRRDFYLTP